MLTANQGNYSNIKAQNVREANNKNYLGHFLLQLEQRAHRIWALVSPHMGVTGRGLTAAVGAFAPKPWDFQLGKDPSIGSWELSAVGAVRLRAHQSPKLLGKNGNPCLELGHHRLFPLNWPFASFTASDWVKRGWQDPQMQSPFTTQCLCHSSVKWCWNSHRGSNSLLQFQGISLPRDTELRNSSSQD